MIENALKSRFPIGFFREVPTGPGIYLMLSRSGKLLYVGKAKNLRARLLSYRHVNPLSTGENILELLPKVRRIEWEQHASEERAALREREVIRALVPPHNVADAWQEDFFFVGLGRVRQGMIDIELTDDEDSRLELHGCFAHRRLLKNAYNALLRLLFACSDHRGRFSFPAVLCRSSPVYQYKIRMPQPRKWRRLISDFFHAKNQKLLHELMETLLLKEDVPEYVRPGLQRDLDVLVKFADSLLGRLGGEFIDQQTMRDSISASVAQLTA